jgi:hypothetical protein
MLDDVRQGVKVLIKHRWANFFARINITSPTYFNVDDITIDIGTNLPSMTDENINQQLALNGILSQKTLLSNLGYDYATEKKNKEEEAATLVAMQPNPQDPTAPMDTDDNASEKTSTVSTTASQTNNQIEAKVDNKPKLVPDKTKNIKKVQSREGRPTK